MEILRNRYVIAVHDLQQSAAFYSDILGFKVYAIDDPGWLFAEKDSCLIMMGECRDAIAPAELGDHSYFAYLEVSDVDAYYQQITDNGGKPKYGPTNKPWGMREFPIKSPGGHRIMVGQAI